MDAPRGPESYRDTREERKLLLGWCLGRHLGVLHTTGAERKGAPLFCDLLARLTKAYPHARRVHLILDNYGIHHAALTQRTLDSLDGRIVLHFLPPYCPDANRIERVWQDMHANVTRNHRCKTMLQLLSNARAYLTAYIWGRHTGSASVRLAA